MNRKASLNSAAALIVLFGAALAGGWQMTPATQPAATQPRPASVSTPPRQPTAEDVLREVQKLTQQPRPVVRPAPPSGIVAEGSSVASTQRLLPVAPAVQTRGRLLPEDYRLVDRAGRLVRHSSHGWQFVFEERGRGEADPPMLLMPNLSLQAMEELSAGQPRSPVFVVSGDVTEYRGENYLLVKKVYIRAESGNLK